MSFIEYVQVKYMKVFNIQDLFQVEHYERFRIILYICQGNFYVNVT